MVNVSKLELQVKKQKDLYEAEEEQQNLFPQQGGQYSHSYVHVLPLCAVFILAFALAFSVIGLFSANQGWSIATFADVQPSSSSPSSVSPSSPGHHHGHHGYHHGHHSYHHLGGHLGRSILQVEEEQETTEQQQQMEGEDTPFLEGWIIEEPLPPVDLLPPPEELPPASDPEPEDEEDFAHCGGNTAEENDVPSEEDQTTFLIIISQTVLPAAPPKPQFPHRCVLGWKQGHCHTLRGRKTLYYHKDLKYAGMAALSSQLSASIIITAALVLALAKVYPNGYKCKLTQLSGIFALMACTVLVSGFIFYGHFMKRYNLNREAYIWDSNYMPTGLAGSALYPDFNFFLSAANAFLCCLAFMLLTLSERLPLVLTILRKPQQEEEAEAHSSVEYDPLLPFSGADESD
ncbi:hypothetical protein QOT17_021893 [Balamuthia mandrillaris]